MIIKRIEVEGGFLDGMDLRFVAGLNVLIGGRGTGKSSVIELLRYCLDVRSSGAEDDAQRSREQALSVLQDGQVTVGIEEERGDMVVSRSANTEAEGLESGLVKPLIFSQTDVESVGLTARGRLNIIDLFALSPAHQRLDERTRVSQVQSLTAEIRGFLREADEIEDRLAGAESVKLELVRAEARSAEISSSSVQLEEKQRQLDEISRQTARLAVRSEALRRTRETVTTFRAQLAFSQLVGFGVEEWPASAGPDDPLQSTRENLRKAEALVGDADRLLEQSLIDIESGIRDGEQERIPLEESARTIRREIEGIKEGAGAVARHLSALREQVQQLDALRALRAQKLDRAMRVQEQRSSLLDGLDALRDARFLERKRIADALTDSLAPLIRVRVRQAAQLSEFTGAISSALRGSGLRYNELAQAIANTLTPRELVEASEKLDIAFISATAKISQDRAERVAAQVRVGEEQMVAIGLDDIVDFELLDGSDFKAMDSLSVGQRCTVVLSILLQHPDRVLIVDQPEDHLDNAFIVDTLIEAVRRRAARSQLIFATHNANIPVLGEASRVIHLASNGKRGFVLNAAPLEDPKSVDSITRVMEGGLEAFQKRSSFYRRYTNE